MLREAFQDLNRLRQIAQIVARHGFGAYLDGSRLAGVLGHRGAAEVLEESERAAATDRKTAARFRQLLVDLGPTFIKLGQLLSSRPDILPSAWIDELAELQDAVPPIPVEEVLAEIERALGKPVTELFGSLDPAPLASASIAQVHRAVTHAGEAVAVKVQRPGTRARVEADLGVLYDLAALVGAVVEETGVYTPADVVEEFDRAIHEELDFSNEARNVTAMRRANEGRTFLVVPRVHEELSTATVLTLEYVEGVKISEVTAAAGYDTERIARHIIDAAFRQLFEDGLFHGDPHPGNILVLPGDRIALLDLGLVGRLTRSMQEALVTLILALSLRDADTIARVLSRIGQGEARPPIGVLRADVAALLDRYLGLKLDEIRTSTLLRDLLDLAVRHRIQVPKEYAVLAKASVTIEGIIRRLYPRLDVVEIGLPYAKELLFARLNPTDARGTLMRSLLQLQSMAEDVPPQLQQILLDLESGRFRVNVHAGGLERVAANVRGAGFALVLAVVASALLVCGFIALAATGFQGLRTLAVAAVLLAGFLLGAAGTLWALGLPRPKISLRRWLLRRPR